MQIPPLNEQDLKDLRGRPLVAKLATVSPKDEVRITPIWFGGNGDSILLNTFEDTGLVRNLRRNPKCSLLIDSVDWPYIGVHYWGTATVEGPENDAEGMGALYSGYFNGDEEAAKAYASKLIGWGKRVYIRFRPERRTTWDFRQAQ